MLSPDRLIAEFRREREITRGYHGREILELLQNAGDAARQGGVKGRVRIVITPHGLVMGNTSRPFDKGGVRSLQTANLSPKLQSEASVNRIMKRCSDLWSAYTDFRPKRRTFLPVLSRGKPGLYNSMTCAKTKK